jgi:hypothetical protein
MFAQIAVAGGILAALIPKGSLSVLGSWSWLVIPILPVAAFFGALILNFILEALEWLAFCLRKCPKCGRRHWSWGFTSGFGL